MTMASVLSGFIDRPLRSSQCCTAVKHSDSVETDSVVESDIQLCVIGVLRLTDTERTDDVRDR